MTLVKASMTYRRLKKPFPGARCGAGGCGCGGSAPGYPRYIACAGFVGGAFRGPGPGYETAYPAAAGRSGALGVC
jgi:hypothetical protein